MLTQSLVEIVQAFKKSVILIVLSKRIDDRLVTVDEITVFGVQPGDAGRGFLQEAGAASSRRPHPTCLHGGRASRPEPSVHRSTLEQQYPKMGEFAIGNAPPTSVE